MMKLFWVVWAILLLAGCGHMTITHHGDARLERTKRFTAFDLGFSAKVVYELSFPPVSLSQPGTTTFAVRDIKEGMIPTDVTLHYPKHSSLIKRDLLEQWGDAKFRLRIVSKDPEQTFGHTFVLAKAGWGHDAAISERSHFHVSLRRLPAFQANQWFYVTDYDVEVIVLEPTVSGSHQVELTRVSLVFLEPEDLEQNPDARPTWDRERGEQ